MKNIIEKNLRQIIMFVFGFCIYITIEVCFRGYSYPIMGVCGGITLLVVDSINNKISWDVDLIIQGIYGSFIVTMMELVIGEINLFLGLPPMWDYSNMPFQFDSVICLPFSLVWVCISIIGVFIADSINYYIFEELPVPYYKVFGKTRITFKEKHCKF